MKLFTNGRAFLVAALFWAVPTYGEVVINEFLASNSQGLKDSDGDSSDWIELRNTGPSVVNLQGWTLTDDRTIPTKWTFPSTNLGAGSFLVVFASGKDRTNAGVALHTSFSLSANGEYLGLFRPEAATPDSEYAPEFPSQQTDVSFGLSGGTRLYFRPPTPGVANGAGFADFVADTKFSHNRGFYDQGFDLVITCKTEGASIRYTTNGAPPTATTGQIYSGPIPVAGTLVIRAAAFKTGLQPSGVDTQTYLFPADIFRQSADGKAPPGWPASWGANEVNYGMDPEIVNSPTYRNELRQALAALPSFVIVTDLKNLFDPATGIYANPGNDGRDWERPASLELVNPDGQDGFQVNCGLRIRGGFSRSTGNPKHALRFFFRDEYGTPKLRYPLFGNDGADTFDNLDLRTFQNYSWSFQGDGRGVFIRDQFNRDSQLEMGHQGERGNYYHLFINGQYWGLYNTCERPEASFGETYFGGQKENFDVIKVEAGPYAINPTDGTQAAWNELYNACRAGVTTDAAYLKLQGLNPDGTPNPAYRNLLDVDNLIDYMLVIYFGGNLDAPISNFLGNTSPNNFYGMRDRTGNSGGFKYMVHDAEHTLLDVGENRTGPFSAGSDSVTKSNPQYFFQRLTANPEFKMQVADRIHRTFFNNGALTPAANQARFARRTNEIFSAVVLESARWGDSKRNEPFTRNVDWLSEVNRIQQDYFPQRSTRVLSQFRTKGWYPAVVAPTFSQHGGPFAAGAAITITAPAGTLYYTTDGTDPRARGGEVAAGARPYAGPVALTESITLRARVLGANNVWSALNEADFQLIQTWQDVLITELMYHPPSVNTVDGDDLEFIELKNIGTQERDLGGLSFTNGIRYTFPRGTRLAPGQFLVLASHEASFTNAHPGVSLAGVYAGRLANGGERLTLIHAAGAPLFDLTWSDELPWPASADGGGFSLVPRNPSVNPNPSDAANWRASAREGGSPSADDPAVNIPPVVINEVLSHTDLPQLDAVELYNPTAAAADVSGWYLTDDLRTPKKYRLTGSQSLPAGGYRILTEADFNSAGGPAAFALSSHGDEVYLFSADAEGNLTGYTDGFAFGAAANGVSFGRHTNSVGEVQFPPQSLLTLGAANAGPAVGPVVLNEIQFQPFPGDVEFIELANLTAEPVPLFDPGHPENVWRLVGADFSFPAGTVLPPRGFAVATAGDPTLFRLKWGIPDSVPVFGPYSGNLADGGERLELQRPDAPDSVTNELGQVSEVVPYISVDGLRYQNRLPWPPEAAGQGASLERRMASSYGDDPANWRASVAGASPGLDNAVNRPPRPDAGADQQLVGAVFPIAAQLSARAVDDGQPGGPLRFAWSQVGGPVGVVFTSLETPNPGVSLPGQGSYTFRVTVSDGEREASDDVVVGVIRTTGDVVFLPAGSTWKYLDLGLNPAVAWRTNGFNDGAWKSGKARLGYGDPNMATTIGFGPDSNNKYITTHFRNRFNVIGVASVTDFIVRLSRDDGAVVYVNGIEAARSNMPETDITPSTLANSAAGGADETVFFDIPVDRSLLREGENTIAVEVHQSAAGSSDLGFDLELAGRVLPPNVGPTASAGSDLTVAAGETVTLQGTFTDDGLPVPPGAPVFQWSQPSGPGVVTFANAALPRTTAQFPTPGQYTLRFSVNDGALTAQDELQVTVTSPQQPPVVEVIGGAEPKLRFTTEAGRSYTLRSCDDLLTGAWERVRDVEAGPGGVLVEVPLSGPEPMQYFQVISPKIP
jgi:CotH kinase protein/Lamin Tail Domain/Chitobiase/beta-hexosaminidase C-terminal domain